MDIEEAIKNCLRENLPASAIPPLQFIRRAPRRLYDQFCYAVSEQLLQKRVSFIIAGAQKCGTTALWHFLRRHPALSMSLVKETDFFANPKYWVDRPDYRIYHRMFEPFPIDQQMGEASPLYMLRSAITAPRIAAYNPAMKIIFILRHPADRAYSQYKMHRAKYDLRLSFEECLSIAYSDEQSDRVLDRQGRLSTATIKHYLKYGHYASQIREFTRIFDRSQLLFLRMDELRDHHTKTMQKIFSFLGVDPIATESKIIHSFDYQSMDPTTRRRLCAEYSDTISDLEGLLGWDLSRWRY